MGDILWCSNWVLEIPERFSIINPMSLIKQNHTDDLFHVKTVVVSCVFLGVGSFSELLNVCECCYSQYSSALARRLQQHPMLCCKYWSCICLCRLFVSLAWGLSTLLNLSKKPTYWFSNSFYCLGFPWFLPFDIWIHFAFPIWPRREILAVKLQKTKSTYWYKYSLNILHFQEDLLKTQRLRTKESKAWKNVYYVSHSWKKIDVALTILVKADFNSRFIMQVRLPSIDGKYWGFSGSFSRKYITEDVS